MLEFLVEVQFHIQVHRWSCLSINNPEFEKYLGQMYPIELKFKDTTKSNTSASYLDLILSIGRDGQLHTSIDKRDDFNLHITNFRFLRSNIPTSPAYCIFISQLIRYARACSSYGCFILRATSNFLVFHNCSYSAFYLLICSTCTVVTMATSMTS